MQQYTASSSEIVEDKLTAMIEDIEHTDEEIYFIVAKYLSEHPVVAGGLSGFVYDRNGVPASTWIVDHNLDRYPHTTLLDDEGNEFEADILYNSLNQITVVLSQPTSGKAVLS